MFNTHLKSDGKVVEHLCYHHQSVGEEPVVRFVQVSSVLKDVRKTVGIIDHIKSIKL